MFLQAQAIRRPAHKPRGSTPQQVDVRRKLRAVAAKPPPRAPPPGLPGPPKPVVTSPPLGKPAKPTTPPPGSSRNQTARPSDVVNDVLLPQMQNLALVSAKAAWVASKTSPFAAQVITCVIDTGKHSPTVNYAFTAYGPAVCSSAGPAIPSSADF